MHAWQQPVLRLKLWSPVRALFWWLGQGPLEIQEWSGGQFVSEDSAAGRVRQGRRYGGCTHIVPGMGGCKEGSEDGTGAFWGC